MIRHRQSIYFTEDSRDWWSEPRGWRDVWRCKRGNHQRVMKAWDADSLTFIARCSCGAIERGYDGVWVQLDKPAGRRS